jgi:hypothetical protein
VPRLFALLEHQEEEEEMSGVLLVRKLLGTSAQRGDALRLSFCTRTKSKAKKKRQFLQGSLLLFEKAATLASVLKQQRVNRSITIHLVSSKQHQRAPSARVRLFRI